MKKGILGGAAVIAVGGLACKLIGALYRIPLTSLIGAEGIGIYQMVFPVYCALLTLSSTGIPVALSRLVASDGEKAPIYFIKSALIFGLIGLGASAIMFVLGGVFARLQGNGGAASCYRALAPSVFFVSLISCVRGYFQGKGNMLPTAVSQVVEQVVKATVGLIACSRAGGSAVRGAVYATLAVTVSEAVALVFLIIRLRLCGFSAKGGSESGGVYKRIFSLVAPVALASIAIPLGNVADSFIVINALSRYSDNATATFGLYSGSVAAIVGLPVSLAYGIAVAAVPALASGRNEGAAAEAMLLTCILAIPFSAFLAVFSSQTVDMLYGRMPADQRALASGVLAAEAASVALLSLLQTVNAVLTARGRQGVPVFSMGVALLVRIVLCAVLTSFSRLGIYGAVIAAGISYLVALALSLAHALDASAAYDLLKKASGILIWSIVCVLGGFFMCRALGGGGWFVLASVLAAVCYSALPLFKFLRVRAKE